MNEFQVVTINDENQLAVIQAKTNKLSIGNVDPLFCNWLSHTAISRSLPVYAIWKSVMRLSSAYMSGVYTAYLFNCFVVPNWRQFFSRGVYATFPSYLPSVDCKLSMHVRITKIDKSMPWTRDRSTTALQTQKGVNWENTSRRTSPFSVTSIHANASCIHVSIWLFFLFCDVKASVRIIEHKLISQLVFLNVLSENFP